MTTERTTKILITICLAVALLSLVVIGMTGFSVKEDKLKIGVVIPLTGPASYIGEEDLNGILLAKEDLKDKNIEIIVEDGRTNSKDSVTAANKLVDLDGVKVVVSSLTGPSAAIAEQLKSKDFVLLYGSTTSYTALEHQNAFLDFPTAKDFCKVATEKAILEGDEKIAFVTDLLGGGKECEDGIKQALVGKKADLVLVERFDLKDPDFKTILTKVKEKDPDALVLYTYANMFPNLYKKIVELDIDTRLVCPFATSTCTGNQEATSLALANDLLVDAVGSDFFFDQGEEGSVGMEFVHRYYNRFKKKPTGFAANIYEDVMMLSKVLENCKGEGTSCITNELYSINYPGITGEIDFNTQGISKKKIDPINFVNGKWE
jgi:branched-chain amino acid transport system substrate-binding protein